MKKRIARRKLRHILEAQPGIYGVTLDAVDDETYAGLQSENRMKLLSMMQTKPRQLGREDIAPGSAEGNGEVDKQ